jgi:ribosomal protein S17E
LWETSAAFRERDSCAACAAKSFLQNKSERAKMANENIGRTAGESSPQNKRAHSEREEWRSTPEDLKSAASTMAEDYRDKATQAWDDAKVRVRTLQEDGEDLKSAASTMAEDYTDKASEALDEAKQRVRTLREDGEEYCARKSNESGFHSARRRFHTGSHFQALSPTAYLIFYETDHSNFTLCFRLHVVCNRAGHSGGR